MKYTLGILGVGVMGQAILSGVINCGVVKAKKIAIFDIDKNKNDQIPYKIAFLSTVQEVINNCEYVLFAVKPQHYATICENVTFRDTNIILSIMAGVKIETIKNKINAKCGIARIMPNAPCKIGSGMSALSFYNINEQKKAFIMSLFDACGETVIIDEDKFDSVTSVSGSGPAYVYMFADALIKGGMNGGLSYEASKKLALNTIIGSALLALDSKEELPILVDKVCSKGGTTIEAVEVFRKQKLEEIIIEGMTACRNKSKKLSETL